MEVIQMTDMEVAECKVKETDSPATPSTSCTAHPFPMAGYYQSGSSCFPRRRWACC